MSGIKVLHLPHSISAKDLKIYFSKPENRGGFVENIYYPLFNQAAVILFKDRNVADTVVKKAHKLKSTELLIQRLPIMKMYTNITADLHGSVVDFLMRNPEALDEIRYDKSLKYLYDDRNQTACLRGNWYQLEWAWNFIETLMEENNGAQRRLTNDTAGATGVDPDKLTVSTRRETNENGETPLISMPSSRMDRRQDSEERNDRRADTQRATLDRRGDSGESEEDDSSWPGDSNKRKLSGDKEKEMRHMNRDKSPSRPSNSDDEGANEREKTHRNISFSESEDEDNIDQAGARSKDHTRGAKMTEIINDDPSDPRSLDFRHGPLTVSIYSGDITLAETDAIVNASNSLLEHYGGVAAAIQAKAGKVMQTECKDYVKENGSLCESNVMHTSAGGKMSPKVKHIIHAVGPIVSKVYVDESIHTLTKTFLNCMTYANKHLKIRTMTIPLISSGVFGGSVESCVKAFLNAVLLYVSEHTSGVCNLREVHLINNNSNHTALTVLQIREGLNQGLEPLTDSVVQEFEKMTVKEDITLRTRSGRSGGYSSLSASNIPSGSSYYRQDFSRSMSGVNDYGTRHSSDRTTARPKSEFLTSTSPKSTLSQTRSTSTNFARSFSSPSSNPNIPSSIRNLSSQNYGHMDTSSRSGVGNTTRLSTETSTRYNTATGATTPHTAGRPLPEKPY